MVWAIFLVVFLIVWALCGFLAYGLGKGHCRNYLIYSGMREWGLYYDQEFEDIIRRISWYGPFGLSYWIHANAVASMHGYHKMWGFCLRMPKELCKR